MSEPLTVRDGHAVMTAALIVTLKAERKEEFPVAAVQDLVGDLPREDLQMVLEVTLSSLLGAYKATAERSGQTIDGVIQRLALRVQSHF